MTRWVVTCAVLIAVAQPAATAETSLADLALSVNQRVVKIYGGQAGQLAGYGSGVLVSADGEIVTVASALLETTNLRVELSTGKTLRAEVVHRDFRQQLALLKIDMDSLPFAELRPTRPGVGDWIIAATNAFQVAAAHEPVTLTPGVVAGWTQLQAKRRAQPFLYDGEVLLTDMVLAVPGAAGGGLFDLDGQLVGLVGQAVQSERTMTWLNYGIPAEVVGAFLEAARQPPSVRAGPTVSEVPPARAYLGIALLDFVGLDQPAYVERVHLNSPASAAGLRANDLVVAVDGEPIESCAAAQEAFARLKVGERVTLTIKRGETLLSIPIEPARDVES
jgi:serine protease Do